MVSTDAIFSSSDINMNDYGGPGMPKVVVIAQPDLGEFCGEFIGAN